MIMRYSRISNAFLILNKRRFLAFYLFWSNRNNNIISMRSHWCFVVFIMKEIHPSHNCSNCYIISLFNKISPSLFRFGEFIKNNWNFSGHLSDTAYNTLQFMQLLIIRHCSQLHKSILHQMQTNSFPLL